MSELGPKRRFRNVRCLVRFRQNRTYARGKTGTPDSEPPSKAAVNRIGCSRPSVWKIFWGERRMGVTKFSPPGPSARET
jgi:hypothetical protein